MKADLRKFNPFLHIFSYILKIFPAFEVWAAYHWKQMDLARQGESDKKKQKTITDTLRVWYHAAKQEAKKMNEKPKTMNEGRNSSSRFKKIMYSLSIG